jgi:ribonuclease P protein component
MKFPKSVRVRKRREYLQFFHQSDVKKLDNCVIFRIPNPLGHPRLGVTVKAKTNSVLRNKVKRQIREHFRIHQSSFKPADYNIVVPGYVRVGFKTGRQVRATLEKLLPA